MDLPEVHEASGGEILGEAAEADAGARAGHHQLAGGAQHLHTVHTQYIWSVRCEFSFVPFPKQLTSAVLKICTSFDVILASLTGCHYSK